MPLGGKRVGAGRKKGVPNKINKLVRAKAIATGELPVAFLLSTMRNTRLPLELRIDAAKAAAPYLHSKMPQALAVTHQSNPDRPLRMIHEMKDPTPQEASKAYYDMLKGDNLLEFKKNA